MGTPPSRPRRRLRPDLALVDIGLPGLDGFEVAERLRRAGSVACIVLTSGRGSRRLRRPRRDLGRRRLYRQGRPLGRSALRVARRVTTRAAARLVLLVPLLALAAGHARASPRTRRSPVAPLDYVFDAGDGHCDRRRGRGRVGSPPRLAHRATAGPRGLPLVHRQPLRDHRPRVAGPVSRLHVPRLLRRDPGVRGPGGAG